MAHKPMQLKIIKGDVQKAACPLCQQPAVAPYTPFCSRRCAQLDLGKWLTGAYAIPAFETMDDKDVDTLLAEHEAKFAQQVDEDS